MIAEVADLDLPVGKQIAISADGGGELHIGWEAQASVGAGSMGAGQAAHHTASQHHLSAIALRDAL